MTDARRALVCDGATFSRDLIAEILTGAGYAVVGEASTGTEAVERYRALRPDLVTLEAVMPELGGIDAVREIVRVDPEARILMCSAIGERSLVAEAMRAGAREFVVKPFHPSRVLEAVQRVLG